MHGGINYQMGYLVLGAEIKQEWTSIKSVDTTQSVAGVANIANQMNVNWDGAVVGRLGYLVTPNLLLAGFGGEWGVLVYPNSD